MATTKSTTPRKRATSRTTGTRSTATTKTRATSAKTDDSLIARTGRTIKQRPYTSAAIATGAATIVAAAAAGAAGAFLLSRRDKSFKEASSELTAKVKGGLASATESVKEGLSSATETVKDGFSSATETVKDLGQRGSHYFKGEPTASGDTRTQQQIAEEALTLKETGAATSPLDDKSATEIKIGAVAY